MRCGRDWLYILCKYCHFGVGALVRRDRSIGFVARLGRLLAITRTGHRDILAKLKGFVYQV